MVKQYPVIVDATYGVTSKVNESRVFYYAFIFYNRSIKTEPVPFLEVLINRSDENILTISLNYFLGSEKEKYGPKSGSKPLVVICDLSWPIIKCMLSVFNRKSLDDYINDCYLILNGTASYNELPKDIVFTVVHFRTYNEML